MILPQDSKSSLLDYSAPEIAFRLAYLNKSKKPDGSL